MDDTNAKKEVLHTLADYLKRFIPGTTEVIHLLRIGKEAEALKSMGDIVEGLQWMYDAIALTEDVQIKKIEISTIKPYLSEIADALESMDYVLLSDLLEYEIIPILNNWIEDLAEITQN